MNRELWVQRLFWGVHSYAATIAILAVILHLVAAHYHWSKWHNL